jgi:hypothetical protein
MASKYDSIPIKLHKARVEHICLRCDTIIARGQGVAYQRDDLINQVVGQKKYCENCFNELGQDLIRFKKPKDMRSPENQSHL